MNFKKTIRNIVISFIIIIPSLAYGVSETTFVLNFSSLPSSQGFVYSAVGNSLSESSIFSVDGTTLFQDSLAAGFQGSGENVYRMANALDHVAIAFTLEVRARLLIEQRNPPSGHNHNGLFFGFPGTNNIHVGDHAVGVIPPPDAGPEGSVVQDSVLLDTSQFHEYRLDGDMISNTYQFFVDGALRAEGSIDPNNDRDLALGDGSGGSNAKGEITELIFTLRYQDDDNDGFSPPVDCDDTNPAINPDAPELPGNFVDENCDGNLGECDPCSTWSNHGQYVRCVAHVVEDLVAYGLITEEVGDTLVTSGAQSDIGKKGFIPFECQ